MNERLPNEGKSARRGLALRLFGTLLSLGLLVFLIKAQGWDEFRVVLTLVSWRDLALVVGLILASRVFVTLRWLVLLRYAGASISFWQALRLMFMGNFASNFLPSTVGGDFVRLAGLVSLGTQAGLGAASLIVDRLVGMVGMASFSPYGLFLVTQAIPPTGATGIKPALPALALFGRVFERVPGAGWLIKKTQGFLHSLLTSSAGWLRHPLSLVLALLYNYGHMLFTFVTIWIVLRAMQQPVSLLWIGALWSLSYFISLVPVSINGLGLQEVSITMLYSQFGGVSMEAALALAVWMRMLFLLASLPGALFLPEILRPVSKSGLASSQPTNQI